MLGSAAISRRTFVAGTGAGAALATVGFATGTQGGTREQPSTAIAVAAVVSVAHGLERSERPPVRGNRGLTKTWRSAQWQLHIVGPSRSQVLRLRDLSSFEPAEQVTELRGAHGWTTVVHWGGVRLGDVLAPFGPFSAMTAVTPDGRYRASRPAEAAIHPFTLLATHLGGSPLDIDHGAPVRLVVPTRPAAESVKRVARLTLTVEPTREEPS